MNQFNYKKRNNSKNRNSLNNKKEKFLLNMYIKYFILIDYAIDYGKFKKKTKELAY